MEITNQSQDSTNHQVSFRPINHLPLPGVCDHKFISLGDQIINVDLIVQVDFHRCNGEDTAHVEMLNGSTVQCKGNLARKLQQELACRTFMSVPLPHRDG